MLASKEPHRKVIEWSSDMPPALMEDVKRILYLWMRVGRPGRKPAVASTITNTIVASGPLLRRLAGFGVRSFGELTQIHISTYLAECKAEKLTGDSLAGRLTLIDLAWTFRDSLASPLRFYPWGSSSLLFITGAKGQPDLDEAVGKTPVIPRQIQAKIFNYCIDIIDDAPRLLAKRDAGKCSARSPHLLKLRDACLYVVLITTAMRQDEVVGVENNAYRTEVRNGISYNWVRAEERKTGKGLVEYLAPDITLRALAAAEAYAAPFQAALRQVGAELKQRLKSEIGDAERAELLQQLAEARAYSKLVFLNHGQKHVTIRPLSAGGVHYALLSLSRTSGARWQLTSHQCRRTYARMVIESSMGRVGLVFLKEQFKHSSLTMTQRYALNPAQDATLFEEMLEESLVLRHELLERWGTDAPLSGGAGRKIIQIRGTAIKDHPTLLRATAEAITIRGTGHGWCIAQDGGCGGGGLYDATMCVDCKNGVIDEEWQRVWIGIRDQHGDLLRVDIGPGARARSQRMLDAATKVLNDLGVC